MKQTQLQAKFVKSINGTDPILTDNVPQVVFCGRSNVGKSSLINSLVGFTLARSSNRPGKTITLDFFRVESVYFVDVPGYGFARRSQEQREHFQKLLTWYLFRAEVKHKLIVLIVDAYVGITDLDRESLSLFTKYELPYLVVANKIDKVKMRDRAKILMNLEKECQGLTVVPYSSHTNEGRDRLLKYIFQ